MLVDKWTQALCLYSELISTFFCSFVTTRNLILVYAAFISRT